MAMVINTNVASLNAQRNLARSEGTLNQAMERLSTGLRINSAKDDAAGLAIATRFTTQIKGLDQAVRNANDGISLAQTSESALSEMTTNLQRIRELAVQSANATNTVDDRLALDAEVKQRLEEITRIASQTSFNGKKVLDGSFGMAQFQVGANIGETIDVDLSVGMKAQDLGSVAQLTTNVTSTALTSGNLQIQIGTGSVNDVGASIAGSEAGQTASSAYAKAQAINNANIDGLVVDANNSVSVGFTAFANGASDDAYSLDINGINVISQTGLASAPTIDDIANAVNTSTSQHGVTAAVNGSNLVFTASDGRDITLSENIYDNGTTSVDAGGLGIDTTFTADAAIDDANRGSLSFVSNQDITFLGTPSGGSTEIGSSNVTTSIDFTTSLADRDIQTVTNAEMTIASVDAALESLSAIRSDFGAVQNRFESTIFNLQTISESLSASKSRIEDADFAAETAKLTKAQILQQAGVSILAQANQRPQAVLGLLQ